MTSASTLGTPALPALPHWETPPADLTAAIREIKAALRARIAASGRTVEEVFAVIEARVAERGRRDRRGEGARRDGLAGHRLRRHRGRHRHRRAAGQAAPPRLPRRARSLRARAGHWPGTRTSSTTSRATGSSRTTAARATTSSAASAPSPRSTPSTGRRHRCRPARATGWPACRPSSTASGAASPTACSGSTPTATRSTPTASAAGPRAPTPAASAPTSTPAPSTCG